MNPKLLDYPICPNYQSDKLSFYKSAKENYKVKYSFSRLPFIKDQGGVLIIIGRKNDWLKQKTFNHHLLSFS